jgi:hypothetical protein
LSGFDSVQCWESDVKKNQVRLQFSCLLNPFLSVGHFADDVQVGSFSKCRADKFPKGREILYNENAD